MALIKCSECKLQVSDKALSCPHCGYPMQKTNFHKQQVKKINPNKHKRLPNGFGSIINRTTQNLRNPYYARICVGRNTEGKILLKPLKPQASFKTYNEAYAALLEYNRNPYDLDDDITLMQLYEKWTDTYFKTLQDNSARTIISAWAFCTAFYDMRAKDVRARHIKACMDEGYRIGTQGKQKGEKIKPSPSTKSRIKSLFNLMFDYALEYELVTMNYARTFDISDEILNECAIAKKTHCNIGTKDLNILWNNVNNIKYVDLILIQCYGGWRPQELGLIELKNVYLDEGYIVGGMKTDAGKNRIVPIHPKILEFVKKYYLEAQSLNSNFLFNCTDAQKGGYKMTYDKWAYRFRNIMELLNLNPNYRPHDPRKTFVTMAKKATVDEYVIKLIVGHKILDLTEETYTVRSIDWLKQEMFKMI